MNVVREYNLEHFYSSLALFVKMNKALSENKTMLYEGSKIIGTVKNDILVVPEDNKYLDKGEYDAFDLLIASKYQGDEKTAFNHLIYQREKDIPYIRVGVDYFKKVTKVDRYGISRTQLKKWNRLELKDEFGKDFQMLIAKYDDFAIVPDNKEYKGSNGNYYNLYAEFPHKPVDIDIIPEDHLKWTMILMKHIFGEQLDLGLKYMKVVYENPKQQLPILVLVSNERQTGKSTFIDWLTQFYGENMVIINPEDITSNFNGSYANKNVIAIEESKFESTQALEKLKALATQKKISVNEKYVANYSIPFFGKLIITSNDEHKFVKIDQEEIRYWIRQIPPFPKENENFNILDDLRDEIPYFLKYLIDMDDFEYKSRMVFSEEEIQTTILTAVKKESHTWLFKDLEERFIEHFNNCGDDFIEFTPSDLKDKYYLHAVNVSISFIRQVIKNEFKLSTGDNRRYHPFTDENIHNTKVGMAFKIDRKDMSVGFDRKDSDEDGLKDVPF